MSRFTLERGKWYACEFMGDFFNGFGCDCSSYSPIKIYSIESNKSGDRTYNLNFFHANYPGGVNDKEYKLKTIERGEKIILAKSIEDDPARYLYIYDISAEWVKFHFPHKNPNDDEDIQLWLENRFNRYA